MRRASLLNSIQIILTLLVSVTSAAAWGMTDDARPVWVQVQSTESDGANSSYLGDLGFNDDAKRMGLRNRLFNDGLSREMGQQYGNITKDYDLRENYHLNRLDQTEDQMSQKKGFVRYFLLRIFHFHVKDGIQKAETNSDEVRVFKKVYDKGEQIVNEGVKIEAGEKVKFGTNLDVRKMRGGLWMTSAVVNGAFDVVAGAPAYRDPNNPDPSSSTDPTYHDERYRVSLTRKLPVWDLSSGVSYGTTSTMVSTNVSKQLNEHLLCVVNHSVPMNPDRADVRTGQETAQMQYQIHF